MLLENNTKNVIDLIKMYDELRNTDKLKLAINILENKSFNINLEVEDIVAQLNEVLNNLDSNYMRTITNFSKYNYLLFFSARYLEMSDIEKKKFILEILFNIYETDFLDTKLNKFINEKLSVYEYYYAIL